MGLGPFGPHFDSIREGDRLVAVENEDLDVVGPRTSHCWVVQPKYHIELIIENYQIYKVAN